MYNMTKEVDDIGPDKLQLEPGISENVEIDAEYETLSEDSDKDPLLMFYFRKRESDNTVRESRIAMYPVDFEREKAQAQNEPRTVSRSMKLNVYYPDGVKQEEVVKGETYTPTQYASVQVNDFLSKVKHFMGAVVPESELVFNSAGYAEFAKEVVRRVKKYKDSTLCRVKLVLNNKDYISLPRYGTFVESMNIATTRLKINAKYDKLVPAPSENAAATGMAPGSAPTPPPAGGSALPPPPITSSATPPPPPPTA